MVKICRCKKEYIDEGGFISFTPSNDYVLLKETWYGSTLLDDYNRETIVKKEDFFLCFYTDSQTKSIKRKEKIEKLNK